MMRKLAVAFEGSVFPQAPLEFARRINQVTPVLLAGVFVPQVEVANVLNYAGGLSGPTFFSVPGSNDAKTIQENIRRFEDLCRVNDIKFIVHYDGGDFPVQKLKKESRFADLLILGTSGVGDPWGSTTIDYLASIGHNVECPLLVVPEGFAFPKKIILAYDGNQSSVFAIKQFAYLFPELLSLRVELVFVHKEADDNLPFIEMLTELMESHFRDYEITKLRFNHFSDFSEWLRKDKEGILVCGSFGRSGFSELFRKSFAGKIIEDRVIPVFVAHS